MVTRETIRFLFKSGDPTCLHGAALDHPCSDCQRATATFATAESNFLDNVRAIVDPTIDEMLEPHARAAQKLARLRAR